MKRRVLVLGVLVGLVAGVLAPPAARSSNSDTFRTEGVRIRHPSTWYATARPLTPVTYPAQVLAVASFALPEKPRANGCRPAGALVGRQPAGAIIFVIEYGVIPPGHFRMNARRVFPSRPPHFKLHTFANYECFGPSYQVRFREAGRYFQIFASFGRRAGPAVRDAVVHILDSFEAMPR
jgi:hypothetical protein